MRTGNIFQLKDTRPTVPTFTQTSFNFYSIRVFPVSSLNIRDILLNSNVYPPYLHDHQTRNVNIDVQ